MPLAAIAAPPREVEVRGRRVDHPASDAKSLFDGCLRDIRWGLEDTQPEGGHLDAIVESDAGLGG